MISNVLIPTVAAGSAASTANFFLGDCLEYAVQAVFTGSNVAGTFSLNYSVDGVNFLALSGKSTSISSSGGTILGDSAAYYPWVQISWAYSSGTGNITVTLAAKQIHLSTN